MINGIKKETIVSTTEDRLTLLNWLKKLEKTLSDDTLTDIAFTDDGGNVSLALTFEDGTTKSVAFPYNMSAFAKKSEVTYGLALKADIAGQAFSGPVTAPSIIEEMSGYSFSHGSYPALTLDYHYAGVVKNGNKITFAFLFDLTRIAEQTSLIEAGVFNIPSSIGEKLFPTQNTWLAQLSVYGGKNYYEGKQFNVLVIKDSNKRIRFNMYNVGTIADLNTKYTLRVEVTFLLSDNLAS